MFRSNSGAGPAILAAFLAIVLVTPAGAQAIARLASPDFNESLSAISRSIKADDKLAKVAAARTIVGLHYGKPSGPLLLDEIGLNVPKTAPPANLCVRVLTRDGRYWALNGYVLQRAVEDRLKFETSSKFGKELRERFKAEDAVVKVIAAKDCQETSSGALIPAIPPASQSLDTLNVFINATGSRVAARIMDAKAKTLASGVCVQARSEIISYTAECRFPLDQFDRRLAAKLQITLAGDNATTTIVTSDVRLPE